MNLQKKSSIAAPRETSFDARVDLAADRNWGRVRTLQAAIGFAFAAIVVTTAFGPVSRPRAGHVGQRRPAPLSERDAGRRAGTDPTRAGHERRLHRLGAGHVHGGPRRHAVGYRRPLPEAAVALAADLADESRPDPQPALDLSGPDDHPRPRHRHDAAVRRTERQRDRQAVAAGARRAGARRDPEHPAGSDRAVSHAAADRRVARDARRAARRRFEGTRHPRRRRHRLRRRHQGSVDRRLSAVPARPPAARPGHERHRRVPGGLSRHRARDAAR